MKLVVAIIAALLYSVIPANAQYNVTLASGGCPAAIPGDGLDDHAAIQCYIDLSESDVSTGVSGGVIFFPSGRYHVSETLVVPGAQLLIGEGPASTSIASVGFSDIKVLQYNGPDNSFGGMEKITIACSQSATAQAPCVRVGHNVPVTFRDCHILGGLHALWQDGVDGRIDNCVISAMARNGANLYSRGANWYLNTKFNPHAGQTVAYAYAQNPWDSGQNNGVQENHFVNCDFSGNFDYSVVIYDAGANQAVTTFTSSVFAAPIYIAAARSTIFTANEFGHTVLSSYAPIALSGNYSFSSTALSGSGARSCGANIGVVC